MGVVSVESFSASPDVQGSQPTIEDPYKSYVESGGILNVDLFQKVKSKAKGFDIQTLLECTRTLAKNMAGIAGLELTDQTVAYYGILGQNRREVSGGNSDQRLLAQALLLSGEIKSYHRFISAFPQIFPH